MFWLFFFIYLPNQIKNSILFNMDLYLLWIYSPRTHRTLQVTKLQAICTQ